MTIGLCFLLNPETKEIIKNRKCKSCNVDYMYVKLT